MKNIALFLLVGTTAVMAGGYKIPESSLNAVALSNAYVANANGADASYYNPANMVFSENKSGAIEVDLTYIGLSAMDFKGTTGTTPTDTSSKTENFIVPTLHYVSFKDDRAVANSTLNGEFTNSRAYLVSLGTEYKF